MPDPDDADDSYSVMHEAQAMLARKGADYATTDRLAQFKRAAADLSLTPRQVWAVYFDKGYAAIRKWTRGEALASEGIRERIVDAIAYLTILSWIVLEESRGAVSATSDLPPAEALHEMTVDAVERLRAVADASQPEATDAIHEATNTLALVISALEASCTR